jgi:hypothetical protein
MRRIRRARERHARGNKLFKRRVLAAGAAAAISLAAGAGASGVSVDDRHRVPVSRDADRDLLSDREELALGYQPSRTDQNRNTIQDGAELAMRCADAIAQLPSEEEVTDPGQTYKRELHQFGTELCEVCGETINMGPIWVVNPRLGLELQFTFLGAHYLAHGSFSYSGETHKGRVNVPRLLRVLELRFPYEPNDHQLPLGHSTESGDRIAPEADDLDEDGLADAEELAVELNLYDADQNDNLLPDGIELAQRCAEVIDRLPSFDPNSADAKGVYKINFMMRGLEWCGICGESVNMGYWQIVNSTSGASMDVPVIAWHFMQHGSFSYLGDVHGRGRSDVAALLEVLELPNRCGDLGTLHLPADLNKDCKIDFADVAELAERWLASTDPDKE